MIYHCVEKLYNEGAFPGANAAVVDSKGVLEEVTIGNREIFPSVKAMDRDTLFDMASLSKILGPTIIAMRLKTLGRISFDERIGSFFPSAGPYKDVSLFELLTHQGGFPAEDPTMWRTLDDRAKAFDYILSLKPEYRRGERVVYSCLGYIILAHILELITSEDLETLARSLIWDELGLSNTSYYPKNVDNTAATEITYEDKERCYKGVVHDETARFLRPILSGNAGVFSNISDMEKFCTFLLSEYKKPRLFASSDYSLFMADLTPFADNSRSIGFCINKRGWKHLAGSKASPESFGHTGFTGTSIWIDPLKDRAAILLSNRVHPSRENKILLDRRCLFHDAAFSS